MGISAFHSGWQEGRLAYLEAENALEARFIKGNARLLSILDLINKQEGRENQNEDILRGDGYYGDTVVGSAGGVAGGSAISGGDERRNSAGDEPDTLHV